MAEREPDWLSNSRDEVRRVPPHSRRCLRLFLWAALAGLLLLAWMWGSRRVQPRPRWDIQGTLAAMRSSRALHVTGYARNGGILSEYAFWARPATSNALVSGDLNLRLGQQRVIVCERSNVTVLVELRTRETGGSVAYLSEGVARRLALPTVGWLEEILPSTTNWSQTVRQDPVTRWWLAVVRCRASVLERKGLWELSFDLRTSLPVRMRCWAGEGEDGEPDLDLNHVDFKPDLPPDIFAPHVPEEVQVVDCAAIRRELERRLPNLGQLVPAETPPQTALENLIRAYWQAVIQRDWNTAEQLRFTREAREAQYLREHWLRYRPAELLKIAFMRNLAEPAGFAEVGCELRFADGTLAHSVLNAEVFDSVDGRVAVITGNLGPDLIR